MIRWLEVKYPEYDYKSKNSMPILCRARDMGKVIYGKWIIGGSQYNIPADSVYPDDEEIYYVAYKLVGGAKIFCNFELDAFHQIPFLNSNPDFRAGAEARYYYDVDAEINSYNPVCCDPEIDSTENGLIYIKMPSGAETKSADDAAEEKSTDRPQILKGDIVRFILGETGKEVVEVATIEIEEGPSYYTRPFSFNPFYNEVAAIYRFDGKDFKCIWESENYKLCKWNEALADAAETARRASVSLKAITAALESLANEKSKKGEQ